MKILSSAEVLSQLEKLNVRRPYKAMYSSLFGGIVTDPALMFVPIDDHIVHRGDGVFEALRVTPTQIYLLKPHLLRLQNSAGKIGLKLPCSHDDLAKICEQVREVARTTPSGFQDGILRIFVSRGPGDFSPNPYSTLGSQLYVVATDFNPTPKDKYEKGVSLGISEVPIKPGFYAQVKSCNYLPNVMMKKEAIDRGFDFMVNLNEEDFVAEGPTENLMILTREGQLIAPKFDYTLSGTTLLRALGLAENKLKNFVVATGFADISVKQLQEAQEVMMVGTTLGVLAVTRFESSTIGNGSVGEVARRLHALILQDQVSVSQ